jgi:hypothetical protein
MHAIAPIIRLDSEDDFRPINLFKDWHVNETTRIVHHFPSKLTFVINYEHPAEGSWVKPCELTARLIHICDGRGRPINKLRQIGKDAIHAFLLVADVCHKPFDDSEIPF